MEVKAQDDLFLVVLNDFDCKDVKIAQVLLNV